MQIDLLNDQGQVVSQLDVLETVFGRAYNEDLVHQVVVAFQANGRQGTRAQKDREQVRHSTKKPFKQKGTGRARAGMTSSPLWRGGGRIFPNMPDENPFRRSTFGHDNLGCSNSGRLLFGEVFNQALNGWGKLRANALPVIEPIHGNTQRLFFTGSYRVVKTHAFNEGAIPTITRICHHNIAKRALFCAATCQANNNHFVQIL